MFQATIAPFSLPVGNANHLVLSQPLGTVVHAWRKLPEGLETAVVLGQGPIGQLFTALLRQKGVAQLIAVDLLPERSENFNQDGCNAYRLRKCSGSSRGD